MSISALPKALFRKWEHLLFWGLAVLLVATGLSWYRGLAEGEGRTVKPNPPPRPGSLLNADTAFAFRTSLEEGEINGPHPFFAVLQLDDQEDADPKTPGTERKRRPWGAYRQRKGTPPVKPAEAPVKVVTPAPVRKIPPKPVVKQAPPEPAPVASSQPAPPPKEVVSTPTPPPEPAPEPEPPKPKPKKKVMRVIEHRGVVGTPSGKRFALVQEVNTKQLAFVAAGSMLGDFKVDSFGNDSLEVTGPDGKKHTIPFGGQKKIVIE